MSITPTMNDEVWQNVRTLIQNVLLKRKFHFTKEQILKIIKKQLTDEGFDLSVIDCAYLEIMFLNILDDLVNENILYPNGEFYIPSDYMALKEYETRYAELLYLLSDDVEKSTYINVATLKREKYANRRDFLLTGGYLKEFNNQLKTPDIPLREIVLLYRNFSEEGASKDEAINQVLNYYQIRSLAKKNNACNVLLIARKEKQKHFTRKLER